MAGCSPRQHWIFPKGEQAGFPDSFPFGETVGLERETRPPLLDSASKRRTNESRESVQMTPAATSRPTTPSV